MSSLLGDGLTRRLPVTVAVGLVVALCGHLGWLLRASSPMTLAIPARAAQTAAPVDPLTQALAAPLLDGAAAASGAPSSVTPTALDARLQGVSTGLAVPLAIIDYAGHSRVVGEGDALGDEARVHRILPDRVLLQHGDRFETLALHRAPAPGGDAGASATDEPTAPDDDQVQQWVHTLSEDDPETAAWLRERLQELHERKQHE